MVASYCRLNAVRFGRRVRHTALCGGSFLAFGMAAQLIVGCSNSDRGSDSESNRAGQSGGLNVAGAPAGDGAGSSSFAGATSSGSSGGSGRAGASSSGGASAGSGSGGSKNGSGGTNSGGSNSGGASSGGSSVAGSRNGSA